MNLPEGPLSKLLHADDLFLICETIDGLWNKFLRWKEFVESKCLKVNLGETKVMVIGGITRNDMSRRKVYPCEACRLVVRANSVLCVHCGKWNHGRCAGVKRVIPEFSITSSCRKCEGNIREAVEKEKVM